MKKFLIGLVAALCVMICCVALAGCGGPVDVAGKTFVYDSYKYEGEVPDGVDFEKEEIEPYFGQQYFVFGKDGTVDVKAPDGDVGSGTYTQDGSKLVITIDGDPMEFKVDGKKIVWTIDEEGSNLVLYYKVK